MCAFYLVVDRDVLRVNKSSQISFRQQFSFSFFMSPKSIKKIFDYYCIKQIDYIFPCVCTVINRRRRCSV